MKVVTFLQSIGVQVVINETEDCHRLKNSNMTVVKLCKRKICEGVLRNKKKL